MKRILILLLVVGVLLGAAYALMFFKVIKVDPIAARSPAVARILTALRLYRPTTVKAAALPKAKTEQGKSDEAKKVEEQRKALEQREVDLARREQELAQQRVDLRKMSETAPGAVMASQPDPLIRMVRIYEKISAEDAAKIFAKMNDSEVAELLAKMKERQVGGILPQFPPDRAARLTRMLTRR